ncbi:MAG TPA: PqqD family protein [Bacillota bacterium]|nr:PqqD family protein [Bacillota bacterium]
MKTKKGFILRPYAGQSVVIAIDQAAEQFNGMIQLNETAAFLWLQLEQDSSEEMLLQALLAEYDVDEITARQSITDVISVLREADLLEGD